MEMNNDIFTPDPHIPEPVDSEDIPISAPAKDENSRRDSPTPPQTQSGCPCTDH